MIDIEDLSLIRDGKPILHGISTRIPTPGLTAVIGPNGAGKSSLLHCLAGLQPADAGSLRVNGTEMRQARPADRARIVALLTQDAPTPPRLTVAELVSFGRWPHHRGRPGPGDHAIIAESLAAFDLQALAGRRLDTLSGGQRQRAFVAMAHAQATPWMLLDEPLAALDPKFARDIMQRLHGLARPGPQARGIVVVLHDLAMAARYADWVVALKGGRLIASAPSAEVMTDASLSDLFDTEIRVAELQGRPVVYVA